MLNYSFEQFIIQSCKANEWDLRKFLKRILRKNGFHLIEDDYKSYRGGKYDVVHNLLAIRGNPSVCLVAHTDVCRNHTRNETVIEPDPIIKDRNGKLIIQDRDCRVQTGGDDRLGVAINTWIALNTGYDLGLLFTTDEEVGLVSADYLKFQELMNFKLLAQVDRGNQSHQLVTSIGGEQLCSRETAARLLEITKEIGLPRYEVTGLITDVYAIKTNGKCKEAVNMTCGYHSSYGASENEWIDIQEAKDTMKFVANIVKSYDLEEQTEPSPTIIWEEEIQAEEMELSAVVPCRNLAGNGRSRRNRRQVVDDLFSEKSYERDRRYFADDEDDLFVNFIG